MNIIILGIFLSVYILLLVVSFLMGYFLGNKEESKPIIVQKRKKKVVEEEIEDPIKIMLENIDNYNGTSLGQKDVPEDEEVL